MTTIYFVRHGKYINPKDVIPFRLPGYTLATEGIEQMHKAGKYFKDKSIEGLFCSPIQRTMESAKIIGSEIGLQPIVSDLLIEVRSPLGGITHDDYMKKVKDDIYTYPEHVNGGGETIDEIYKRMNDFKNMILDNFNESRVVVVSHGDPIMIFTLTEQGKELRNHGSILKVGDYIQMGSCIRMNYKGKEFVNSEKIVF